MENLVLSFNVVFPLFAMLALGYFTKECGMVDEASLRVFNRVAFNVFFPIMLFYNVYTTDVAEVFNPHLMIYSVACVMALFFLSFLIVPRIEEDNKKRGVLIQAWFRSNFVTFGVPISASLFGNEGVGTVSLIIAVIIPLFNVLAVIDLEAFRGGEMHVGKMFRGIITNPLIIGTALAGLTVLFGIKLPACVEKPMSEVAKFATPISLFILGGTFDFKKLNGNIKYIVMGSIGRLLVAPMIFISLGVFLGFRGADMGVLLTMLASPVAISSYAMAEQMDSDGVLASQLIVTTVFLAIFTMFLWIFILKQFGWM